MSSRGPEGSKLLKRLVFGVDDKEDQYAIPIATSGTAVLTKSDSTLVYSDNILISILKELKIMNMHLSYMTDLNIQTQDVEV